MTTIVRAQVAHTPRNPFVDDRALEAFSDGAVGLALIDWHLVYLATLAGAAALGIEDEIGELSLGKSADFVLVRPLEGSTLAALLARSESLEDALGKAFTPAREESIAEVRAAGGVVWPRGPDPPPAL